MTSLTDNLLDSATETLVVKIPKHPTGAKIAIRAIKGHSLAGMVVSNASYVDLIFNRPSNSPERFKCTNIGGNFWILTKQAIPLDWILYCDTQMQSDGVAKECVYIPQKQEFDGTTEYTTELLTLNNTLVISGGMIGAQYRNE